VPGRRPGTPGDSVRRDALAAGARAAPGLLVRARRQAARHRARTTGGWEALPARTVGRYGTRYALRAAVATIGLGANRADQAVYEAAERDAAGRPLDGRHRYVVRFAAGTRPPVHAFWSITLYDRRLLLWPNPQRRYLLGDRSPGLPRRGPLTIRISHSPPAHGRATWLPAPAGRFRLYLRLYEPGRAVTEGRCARPRSCGCADAYRAGLLSVRRDGRRDRPGLTTGPSSPALGCQPDAERDERDTGQSV
jgi:hypothetical protein